MNAVTQQLWKITVLTTTAHDHSKYSSSQTTFIWARAVNAVAMKIARGQYSMSTE